MKGFTLVEIMVVLAISAILLAFAAPEFGTIIRNKRLTSEANSFATTLNLARSEAVKRRTNVTVCKSSNGTACVLTGDLSQGRIVFVDDVSTVGTVDAGETILQVYDAMHSLLSFTGTGTGGSSIANFVTYNPNGTTPDAGDATLCDDRTGNFGKIVRINTMGRNRAISDVSC